VSGDVPTATAELYNPPPTGSFSFTGSMGTARYNQTAALLSDGKVLLAGGRSGSPGRPVVSSAEIYNPSTESWTATGSLNVARYHHTATLLGSGEVLVAGGVDASFTNALASAELFGPSVITVAIDIKPGSDPNSINLSSAGLVPVAILSSPTFDATQVKPDSVTLAGARVKLIGKGDRYACSPEDVNGDGVRDVVCHVATAQFMIEAGDTVAVLEAETFDGTPIRGEDSIKIVPD